MGSLFILLTVLSLAGLCCGTLALWRLHAGLAAAHVPVALPEVSLIVPARNEAGRLPRLLASLEGQTGQFSEVIVVDDHSDDDTAAIARARGARVVSPAVLPEGWLGKPWACQAGAEAAAGRHLCFLDADTRFASGGVARLLSCYAAAPGPLSVLPYHLAEAGYEQLSAPFAMAVAMGVGAFTPWGVRRGGMFGPCLMLSREAYDRVGGHTSVKGEVVEHCALTAVCRSRGLTPRRSPGAGALEVRMYEGGVRDLIQGWRRALAAGMAYSAAGDRALTAGWVTGACVAALLVPLCLLVRPGVALSLLACIPYALCVAHWRVATRKLGQYRAIGALLYPLPLLLFVVLSATAGRARSRLWRGRVVPGKTGACPGGDRGTV